MQVVNKETALEKLSAHKHQLLGPSGGCVMCALSQRMPPIAQNEHAVVLLDRFACRYGHLMVVPRKHVEKASQLGLSVYTEVQRLVFEASVTLDAVLRPARVFTATLGAAVELPMTYSHHHVHVIPVVETDERARPARVLSWSEGVVVYEDDEALELHRRIKDAWQSVAAVDGASPL